jgi:2-oxoglutarate dehydrogenase E2 component (dihydrolipoamide succinyltransferase)
LVVRGERGARKIVALRQLPSGELPLMGIVLSLTASSEELQGRRFGAIGHCALPDAGTKPRPLCISMSLEVKIPSVGESITSGLLSVWHKNDGDTVAAGDVLLTLETDKVSSEIQAEGPGVLRIKVPAGTDVKIGEVVATIEEGGAAPASKKTEEPRRPALPAATPSSEPPAPAKAEAPQTKPAPSLGEAVAAANASLSVPSENAPAETREGRSTRKRMSPLRKKIAQQLVMAQHTAAILTTFNEADMSAVMRLRSEMQDAFTKEHGIKLGFMSFFIKAAVSALQAVPAINSRMDGDDLVQNHFYDVGVAVGTERGLVVPVIRNADKLSFAGIERALADYAVKAREGKIKIEDLQGGVFTISNGGIYGSLLSTPILNPPQSGILGMHKIEKRPIVIDDQIVIRPMMYLALSYDHRLVDGEQAVTFLVRVKERLEDPARLLLEV